MNFLGKLMIVLLLMSACGFSQQTLQPSKNACPIILVHGFTGWGPQEMLGYKYWGGTALDIQEYLREEGFIVHTASVGPISSNHDRACELYYQIKGGRVDYGLEHAAYYHHNRYGRTYRGMYTRWNKDHPVHLIGHSMGGQTVRVLVELLARDFFHVGSDSSWCLSVTSISTPHNGTTLATGINQLAGGFVEEIIGGFLALAGTDWIVYDFDLDQWNLKPKPGESLHEFLQRVDNTFAQNKEDLALFDLLPAGAQKLNRQVRTFENIYYFSYATEETYVLDSETGFEWGEPDMNPMLWAGAHYMGHYQGKEVTPNQAWWQNDGVVNTISMKGPTGATIVNYRNTPQRGVWNYLGLIESKDHAKIIGHYQGPISGQWLYPFYKNLATMLYGLSR